MAGNPVVIVGASGRAAAASARRAGFTPAIVDLFADRDTRLLVETIRCPLTEYPNAISDLALRLPPGTLAYTGGLENYPEVIERLAADRVLLGNDREMIASVREPIRLRDGLQGTDLRFPRQFNHLSTFIPCLIKSRTSSGGLGVRIGSEATIGSAEFFEEFIPGQPMSAQFVNDQFLGITEQLVGEPWLHAPAFHYAGNIGPIEVSPPLTQAFEESGRRLGLRGPWGIDFILNDIGAFVLEVNPRYTAAVEILELTHQQPLSFSRESKTSTVGRHIVGKAIYYSPARFTFPHAGPWDADLECAWDAWRIPGFADIPHPGESFRVGQPVLTFFASDSTPEGVRAKLMETARKLDTLFTVENNP